MTIAFQALFAISVVVALIALVRLRPGLFFIAINQSVALRAFSSISAYGQPRSQSFLPYYLFSDEPMGIALIVFGLTVALTAIFAVLPTLRLRTKFPLPRSFPKWVLWLTVAYFVVFAFSVRTIFSGAYASQSQYLFAAPSGGVQAFFLGLLIYELYCRVRDQSLSPTKAVLLFFGVCFVTDYSKGATGLATGFVITAALLFYTVRTRLRRWIPIGLWFAVAVGMGLLIRTVRPYLAQAGISSSVATAAESLTSSEAERQNTGEGLEESVNGSQVAAHVLECIWLYDSGNGREWRSYYLPLLYTVEPAFLTRWLDITRQREAAWELSDYFVHGGGIYMFGEMYWNGGFLCVVVMTILLGGVTWLIDVRKHVSAYALLAFCMYTPSLMQGTQYGVSYPIRGLTNAILAMLLYRGTQLVDQKFRLRGRVNKAKTTEAMSGSQGIWRA